MKKVKINQVSQFTVLLILTLFMGCTTGKVKDANGIALAGVDVTAYSLCMGQGCDANEVSIITPGGPMTGYHTLTNPDGHYFFDPYAKTVATENAMEIMTSDGSPSYKLQFHRDGYQDIWMDYTPDFQEYLHDGEEYSIAQVPEVYLCLDGAIDSDGDRICDDAEIQYGTDPLKVDSDGDGVFDDEELFGGGSPFATNLRSLLHYNINVSDYDESKAFYELLGFIVLLEVGVIVDDPAEAQGLDLPPYGLVAAPMLLQGDGFIIDLIRFKDPYDPEAPHNEVNSLGLATLDLKTDNLKIDMEVLSANGIEYAVVVGSYANPVTIHFADPDGTVILLTQEFEGIGVNSSGKTYIHGLRTTNINVSDLDAAISFYLQVGFRMISQTNGVVTIALQDGRLFTLTESTSTNMAYEDANHLGVARIAIVTTNIDQDIQVLQSMGIECYTSEAIVPSGPLSFLRYVAFEDPDGTILELVEYN